VERRQVDRHSERLGRLLPADGFGLSADEQVQLAAVVVVERADACHVVLEVAHDPPRASRNDLGPVSILQVCLR